MIRAGIIGATGFTGVSLLEVLVRHKDVELQFATTRRRNLEGKYVYREHPNLQGFTELKFSLYDPMNPTLAKVSKAITERARESDVIFICVPSGVSFDLTKDLVDYNARIIDTSPDFRLRTPAQYREYYGKEHPLPELLKKYVYGLPELHKEEIRKDYNPG